MPYSINEPIDPKYNGVELHVISKHGTRVNHDEEVYMFQASQTISPDDSNLFARIAMTKFQFTNGLFNITGDKCIIEFTEVYRDESIPTLYPGIAAPAGYVKLAIPEGYYDDERLVQTVNQSIRAYFLSKGWSDDSFGTLDYVLTQGTYPTVDLVTGQQICVHHDSNSINKFQFMRYRYPINSNNNTDYAYTIELPASSEFWYSLLKMPSTPNAVTYGSVFNYFPGVYDSYVSVDFPDYHQPTRNIFISLDAIPSQIVTTAPSQPNLIGRVPITTVFGETQSWQEVDPFYIEVRNPVISGFRIALYDDDMNLLYNREQPWALSLYFDYCTAKHPYETMTADDRLTTSYIQSNPLLHDPLHNLRKDFFA